MNRDSDDVFRVDGSLRAGQAPGVPGAAMGTMGLGLALPTRSGTLFSLPAALDGFPGTREAAAARLLEWVAAHEEWAVTGFLDLERAEADWLARTRSGKPNPPDRSPVAATFRERLLRMRAAQALDDWLAGVCINLFNELRPLASEIVPGGTLWPPSPEPARQPVLNWALLLPAGAAPECRGRIERAKSQHRAAGLALEVSGPWHPCAFFEDLLKSRVCKPPAAEQR